MSHCQCHHPQLQKEIINQIHIIILYCNVFLGIAKFLIHISISASHIFFLKVVIKRTFQFLCYMGWIQICVWQIQIETRNVFYICCERSLIRYIFWIKIELNNSGKFSVDKWPTTFWRSTATRIPCWTCKQIILVVSTL